MKGKMELFLSGDYMPEILEKFKKDVSLIKFEAERLHIPFKSYHPYYILVYSYLKKLFVEGIILNDKCARAKFHRIWLLADETSAVRINNENHPWTEYGRAVMEQRNSSEVYAIEELQYSRNIKRLDLIVESIQFQAKAAKLTEIGILGRLAFFYHALCFQDPCFTIAMNELWIKLNQNICDEKFKFTYDTKQILPDIIKKTFKTEIKCSMCMFGTGTYATEPDFYYHLILSHTSFRIKCSAPKCEVKAVNRIRMDNHIISQHDELRSTRKPVKCGGCGKWHLTLAEMSTCEDSCAISSTSTLSIYYWEKYYLIWSGQVNDDFTLEQYFFPEQSVGVDKENIEEHEVDESLFNVSFGSDFECSWDDPNKKEGDANKIEEEDEKIVGEEEEKDDGNEIKTNSIAAEDVSEVAELSNTAQESPVMIMTAKESIQEKEFGNEATSCDANNLKRKESFTPPDGSSEIGQIKRALVEQKAFFNKEFEKVDKKLDEIFDMVKMIKNHFEK